MPTTRKRKAVSQDSPESPQESPEPIDASTPKKKSRKRQPEPPSSIVGGPNGDYRINGNESDSQLYKTFTIPTENDKVIPCQLHGPDPKSSSEVKQLFIFTHGAGGGIENPATKLFAEGYAAAGMAVLCFQGTMNLKNRVKSFETVLEYCKQEYPKCEFSVGGRSMGARAAVMLAAEHENVRKIVAVSYPLVNPKGEVRDEILVDLDESKRICFLSGDKDNMCDFEILEGVRRKMVAESKVVTVKNADHGMSVVGAGKDKANAVEEIRKLSGQVAAQWLRGEHDGDGNFELRWDEEGEKAMVENKGAQGNGSRGGQESHVRDEQHPDSKEEPVVKKKGRKSDTQRTQSNRKGRPSQKLSESKNAEKKDEEESTATPRRSKRNKG